jgi:hypothetical protein
VLAPAAAAAAPLLVSAVLPVAAFPFITPLLLIAELAPVLSLSERLQPDAAVSNTIASTINAGLPTLSLNRCFIAAS